MPESFKKNSVLSQNLLLSYFSAKFGFRPTESFAAVLNEKYFNISLFRKQSFKSLSVKKLEFFFLVEGCCTIINYILHYYLIFLVQCYWFYKVINWWMLICFYFFLLHTYILVIFISKLYNFKQFFFCISSTKIFSVIH